MKHEKRKTISIIAPASWSSALINCDYSGLTEKEISDLNTFLALNSLFSTCSHCEDAGFMHHHDASHFVGATECSIYYFSE